MSNPRIRKSPSSPQKAKPTKQFKANMVALDAYSSTIALNETLMSTVKELYKTRDITNIKTATRAMDLLKSNELNKFKKNFADISKLATTKSGKTKAKRETKYQAEKEIMDKEVRGVEREVFKPKLKTSNGETEAPTYEVEFLRDYTNIGEAWDAGVKKLTQMTETHMKKKKNIRLALGGKFQVVKLEIDATNDDPDTVEEVATASESRLFQIRNVQIYNIESVKPTIKNLKSDFEAGFQRSLNKLVGSGWTVKRVDSIFAITHTLKAARGSSYLPTPARYAHPKCGLINIQNHDQECFKWCMLYHQSEQKEKTHRTTTLAKITDKYDYTDITFPISYDQVTLFEDTNKLTINIWKLADDQKTYMHRPGNVLHCRGGMVNLLLVESEEGEEAHYIYIKKLERMLHTGTTGFYKDRKFCPFCSKTISCCEETLEEHMLSKHFSTSNNCNLELPEEGSSMSFTNHKDKMERPFMVYADWECSLIKTHEEGKPTDTWPTPAPSIWFAPLTPPETDTTPSREKTAQLR